MTIKETEALRDKLQKSCDLLIQRIGPIQIGSKKLFPYGWRKAAKGRTVWRIVEEVITQNLEKYHGDFNLDSMHSSDSEVIVYDMKCGYGNLDAYINIKSAVVGGKCQKDDISKADGLKAFYDEDEDKQFFIATFFIQFNALAMLLFVVYWIGYKLLVSDADNVESKDKCNITKNI